LNLRLLRGTGQMGKETARSSASALRLGGFDSTAGLRHDIILRPGSGILYCPNERQRDSGCRLSAHPSTKPHEAPRRVFRPPGKASLSAASCGFFLVSLRAQRGNLSAMNFLLTKMAEAIEPQRRKERKGKTRKTKRKKTSEPQIRSTTSGQVCAD